jgi:hypothetical protein
MQRPFEYSVIVPSSETEIVNGFLANRENQDAVIRRIEVIEEARRPSDRDDPSSDSYRVTRLGFQMSGG